MQELATYNINLPAAATELGRVMAKEYQIGKLLRKIKIKLTAEQFRALNRVFTFWLNKTELDGDLYQQAYYLSVYKIYMTKLQKSIFNIRPKVTLSLDLIQADTLMTALQDYQFDNSTYEMNVILFVIQEIDKQTV